MNRQANVGRVGAHPYRQRCLADKVACRSPDDAAADDAAGRVVEQQLCHSLGTTQGERAVPGCPGEDSLATDED